jgi:ATP-binding cassette subfamily B protein
MLMAYQIHEGERSVGDFVLISSFMMQLYAPLNFLGTYYRMIKTAMVDVEGLIGLLSQEKDVRDDPNPIFLDISQGNVEFRDVKFRYSADSAYVINGISFVVPSGKTVAIVGSSGGGKSTIIRLLYRFYDVTEGSIFLDGKELRTISQRSLRNHIAIVPQDCSLFNDTLGYNIAYGGVCTPGFNVSAAEDRVRWAADKAQLTDFLERQKEGLETKVGERGLRLSGGEKQRVAIARALLKQPTIMCFDEATSALDTKTEREIQAAVEMVSRNRTTLMIAHRLSTVKHADQILVMKAGKILERGTHEELLAQAGEYAEMWAQQSQEELKVEAS